MESSYIFHTLLYAMSCCVLIFPPKEIVGLGLTIAAVFNSWLPLEQHRFVEHHEKRMALTVVLRALLFPGKNIEHCN